MVGINKRTDPSPPPLRPDRVPRKQDPLPDPQLQLWLLQELLSLLGSPGISVVGPAPVLLLALKAAAEIYRNPHRQKVHQRNQNPPTCESTRLTYIKDKTQLL